MLRPESISLPYQGQEDYREHILRSYQTSICKLLMHLMRCEEMEAGVGWGGPFDSKKASKKIKVWILNSSFPTPNLCHGTTCAMTVCCVGLDA